MGMEHEVFERMSPLRDRMLEFGFVEDGKKLSYSEPILDGMFIARLDVFSDDSIEGHVIDPDSGDEYDAIHIDSYEGAFVGNVRKAYRPFLEKIAAACFKKNQFVSRQANRIAQLVCDNWDEQPDHPFKNDFVSGVFRYPANRKWYGIVMNIPESKLEGYISEGESQNHAADGPFASEPMIDVLNVKIDPGRIDDYLVRHGIYRSYHMNKKSWISIALDETLPDSEVMKLISDSRDSVLCSKSSQARPHELGPRTWIVPANPRYFDVDAALAESDTIDWKQGRGIHAGDTVYLYMAAPISAIRYKFDVEEDSIPLEYDDSNIHMTHAMRMHEIAEYDPERMPMSRMRELGVSAVRSPRLATPEFITAIGP